MIEDIGLKARQIPPAAWFGLLVIAGVVFLTWHSYAQNEQDNDWTNPPADEQPPVNVGVFGVSDDVPPGACGGAFRSRCYPGSLSSSRTSHIGGWVG